MSISTRIQAIEQHLTDDYSVLTLAGADLTNVNKNILNLKSTWQERLLYFMNNGTDVVWNNWDKVTGEGTTLTLNNTLEGKMKIDLKGNTYQEGTPTPETPQDIHVVSGDNSIVVCGKNLFHFESQRNTGWYSDVPNMIKEIGAYTLSINDTSLSGVWAVWFADNNGDRIGNFIKPSSSVSTPSTFNVTQEQANAPYIRILPNASGLHDIQNYKIQIEKGNTATTYEPYQSQSYPVNLGVENLWKNQLNGFIPVTGSYPTINSTYPNSRYIVVKLLKGHSLTLSGSTDNYGRCRYIDIDTNQSVGTITSSVVNDYYTSTGDFSNGFVEGTITAKKDFIVGIMDLRATANSLVVNYGGKQTISDNPIELCKIGTYQDRFIRNSGKNLYDRANATENRALNWGTGEEFGETGSITSDFIRTTKGDKFTITFSSQIMFYDSNKEYLGCLQSGGETIAKTTGNNWKYFTTPNVDEIYYVKIGTRANSDGGVDKLNANIMLNKGYVVIPYEPYGNGDWYLEKKIGKVVLDGSESWTNYTNLGNNSRCYYIKPNAFSLNSQLFSNYFIKSNLYETDETGIIINPYGTSLISIKIPNSDLETQDLAGYKTWLSTHNTIVYYVLATPTYTEITDSTLLSQLNALAKSYASQTNISQENNDLASILNATALREMS